MREINEFPTLSIDGFLTSILSKAKRHNARSFPSFPDLQNYWFLVFVRIDTNRTTVYKKTVILGFEEGWNSKNEGERLKDKEECKKLLNILPVRI
jgi:hypothetical protein